MKKNRLVLMPAKNCCTPLALAFLAIPASAQSSSPRQRLSFNENWRFHKGDFSDAKPLGEGYA
ncbi:hypothetical protein EON80_27100, partial [bacterium]